jgi:tetratricopeptide (TPR) repeat protein
MTEHINVKTSLINSRSIIEHYIIIWLDLDINHATKHIKNSFNNIRNIIDSIKIFVNIDECTNFLLQNIKNRQIFMIITDSFHQQYIHLIKLVEVNIQIHSVYLFHNDPSKEINWPNDCKKFKGIFTQIESICDVLEQIICPFENDSSIKSIVTSVDNNLDKFDQSYIYAKLFTEIIYKIEYDDKAMKESFDFCRKYYVNNNSKLNEINEFEENYQHHSPVWWYTKESPINSLLRDALVKQDTDMMIKMGFFIKDLHRAIREIYLETNQTTKLIVYRGQGMLDDDFKKFIEQKGGFYVFHNFISTSTDEETALHFAKGAGVNFGMTGILFQMEIDPLIGSILFASLDKTSYYLHRENEVLFSTDTVFRIGQINKIDNDLWKVNLTLTCDMDQHLKDLTNHIRNEIKGITVWHSLALLLYKMGKYNQAIEIFKRIIETTDANDQEKFMTTLASTQNNIGLMHDSMEDYSSALEWYDKVLEIQEISSALNHPSLATVYNNIGVIYLSMGDYRKADTYCQKALEIRSESSSSNPTSLITAYSNIGMVYELKGNYSTALSYYKKAYEIQKSSPSLYHPVLIRSYNNFGGIYTLMGEYSKALSYYEEALEIQSNSLLPDHPSIANTYSNLGHVYQLMGNYSSSLSYYRKAIKIQEKISSSSQLSLATMYNNIGLVYRLIGDYSDALSYYNKTLKIEESSLTPDHPSLASTYNNLGAVYQLMKEYSTALTYYKKTLKIWQESLPQNHPSLATIHNNIGSLYDSMEDYEQALSYYKKTIEIQEKLPSCNQLNLASTYNNIGEVYRSMKDYPNALSYYQKALKIERKHLSAKHPSLAITVSNMAVAFDANNQHEEAFDHAQEALNIFCDAIGSNHAQTINTRKFLDQLRQKLSVNT